MPKITVMQPFTLTQQDGTTRRFEPGEYDVPEEVANHWFVQHHGPNAPPKAHSQASTVPPYAPNPRLEPVTPVVPETPQGATGPQTPPPSPLGASGGPTTTSDDNRTLGAKEAERFGNVGPDGKELTEDEKKRRDEEQARIASDEQKRKAEEERANRGKK